MNEPEVSIVVPTYNRLPFLQECVESIMEQSFQDFEIIIVDDCSTDGTLKYLEDLRKLDGRIRTFRMENNQGCNDCYNTGIRNAVGNYIAIMDDDDLALPERLQIQKDFLDQHQEVAVVGSLVRYFDENGVYSTPVPHPSQARKLPEVPDLIFRQLFLNLLFIPNPTIMARAHVLKAYAFPPGRGVGGDTSLLLQMAAESKRIAILPEILVLMRRNREHLHMTKNVDDIHAGRMARIEFMAEWLGSRNIPRFDHLMKQAARNAHTLHELNQASRYPFVKSMGILTRCFFNNPLFCLLHFYYQLPLYLEKQTRQRSTL